ncbi:MAG: DUF2490 domain-containing protein [Flavobacteriales bacterium]|nr:DUF2490 domain-containing protein [Flavobacteriales bacterium]
MKGELTKNLKASLQQQVRLNNSSSHVEETFTELGLGYDLPKGLDVGAAYRLSWVQQQDHRFSPDHRYNVDIGYSLSIWKLKTALRARFQHSPSQYLINERLEPEGSPVFVRLKLSMEYRKLKKLTPGIEFETFIRVEDPTQAGANKFRYRAFLEVDLPKRQEFEIFYMLQTDHSDRIPEFQNVVGFKYAYEWKRPKKKKTD